MKKHLALSLLPLSISMVFGQLAWANFDQTIFFGDSLTDTGNIATQVSKKVSTFPDTNGYTTNPDAVWATVLANSYGTTAISSLNGGTNYAYGDAQTITDVTNTVNIPNTQVVEVPAPSAKSQINTYLEKHTINPNALYSVWIGANDFLTLQDASKAPQVAYDTAQNVAGLVNTLHQAGAKYILVPNLPDMGRTPYAISQNQALAFTNISSGYNNLLAYNLKQTNANIIGLDTFHLLQDVVKNPSAYGIDNTLGTACQGTASISSLNCNSKDVDNTQTYVFADGVHPSGATHAILAQYAKSVLDAPVAAGQAGLGVHQAGLEKADAINRHLALATPHEGQKAKIWTNISANEHSIAGTDNKYQPYGMVGVDTYNTLSNHSVTGAYIATGKQKTTATNNNFSTNSVGAGLYHRQFYGNGLQLSLDVGAHKLDTENTRNITLGAATRTHHAEGKGKQLHASVELGKSINHGQFHLTPYIGLSAVKTDLTSMTEDGLASSAMLYGRQNYSDTYGKIGVNGQFAINDTLSAIGQLGYTHQFQHDKPTTTAKIAGLNTQEFRLPLDEKDSSGVRAMLGVQGNWSGLTATAGVTHSSADNAGLGAFLEVGKQF